MTRLSPSEYEELRKRISVHIKRAGYVPPVRELAAELDCSFTTAWRIVRGLGYRANFKHRWKRAESREKRIESGTVS
jgi:hypothetical protein